MSIKKIVSVFLSVLLIVQIIPASIVAHAAEMKEENKEISGYSTNISQDEKEPEILNEDLSKRSVENIKYFNMSNGTTIAAVYDDAVQYQKEDGSWEDIDNSFVASEDSFGFDGYENLNNKLKVKFAKDTNQDKLVVYSLDKYVLEFSLKESYKKLGLIPSRLNQIKTKDTNEKTLRSSAYQTVCYKDALKDTDIEYVLSGSQIKENIIVKSPQEEYNYAFNVSADNLLLTAEKDGSIAAVDSNSKKKVFSLPNPFMVDAKGQISYDAEYYFIKLDDKQYEISIVLSSEWMNDENRVYPVTVDPGVVTEQTKRAIDSTYVASGNPNHPYGPDIASMIMVGKSSVSYIGKCQGLLKFETLPELSVGDVVIDAKLNAVQFNGDAYSSTTPDTALEVHAITSSWNKNTATWNTKPTYDSVVADFEVLKRTECNQTLRQRKWNVTSIVKQWYDGTLDNNGLLLRSSNENASTSNQSCIFAYLRCENAQQSQEYPTLVITYRSNKGIEPYWSYTTFDAGEAGTAYICDFSGNLVFVHDDAQTHGVFGTASVSHVFNNYMIDEICGAVMPYRGHGWMMSCQQQVLPSSVFGLTGTALTTYPYVYIDGDGTEHYFYKKSDNTIVDEDGLGLTLTVPQTNNDKWYRITDDKNNVMWFNKGNALSSTVDSNGNQVTYNYQSSTDARLVSVTDSFNQQMYMAPISNDKMIGSITDAANRTKTFNWASGTLNSIVTHNNRTTTFTYDNNYSILSVTAPDGYKLEFEYTPASDGKRVKKVIESNGTTAGQTITFDYSKYGTTVLRSSGKDGIYGNSDDIYTTTKFDSAGRTVCSESRSNGKTLGASSTEFTASKTNSTASNIRQLNRVSKMAQAGKLVRNYLLNGNSETTSNWTNAQWNGTASFTSDIDSSEKSYGKYSRKISSTSINEFAAARVYQTLISGQYEANKTYTYSAWVKTLNITAVSSAVSGAEIFATYWDADNNAHDFHSEQLIGTTSPAINNGWQRISVTFTVPAGATQVRCNLAVRNSTGDAWFDGIQLEEGSSANPFNIIENASFERYSSDLPVGWTGYDTDSNDVVSSIHALDGTYGFRFFNEPMTTKHISQDINFSGSTANNDDSYVLSGWMWANPIEGNDGNNIGFCIKIFYNDSTSYQKYYDFNHSVKGWQYYTTAFTLRDKDNPNAEKIPTKLRVYLINHRQSNNTWFDNIQLVRDEAQSFTYDSDGNLISVTENAQQKSTMEYTNKDLTKSIDAKGYNYQYTYDSNHNMTKATSQTGVDYNYTYNTNGMPTSLTINSGNSEQIKTELVYRPNGQYVKQVKDQDGNIEQYSYNAARGLLSAYTDKNGTQIQYSYNSQTDLITSVEDVYDTAEINFYYNSDLRLNRIINNGTSYYFDYDAFGNTTQTRVGTQALSTNTYGTNNGELQRVTYGNGVYKDYTYDDYGNIISESVNGTPQNEWQYDSFGNLYSYKDLANSRKILYNYDSTGRLIRQSTVNNSSQPIYTSEYGYDLNNNITRFSSSAGGVNLTESYTYGQDNLPSQYSAPSGKTVSYSFDNLNRLTGKTYNLTFPVSLSYEYASSERNTGSSTYTTTKISTETLGDDVYSYIYDPNGNITEIYRQTINDNAPVLIQSFYYDEINRLYCANDLIKNVTEYYDYDEAGNILDVETYSYDANGYVNSNSLISTDSYGYTDTNWKDKLTSYNNQAITYDEIGNPLSYKGYTLSWQNGRQLATLSGNGVNASYTYDCDGYRTSKTVNGVVHNYYYMGDRLQYEQFGNNKLCFLYDADGLPAGVRYDDGTTATYYYYVCNWRGDVVALYSDTALVCKYDYDAWGNITAVNDANGDAITSSTHIANINPIRYRGYYYDSETNLYYLSSRYYDPQIRRFINADGYVSTGQGLVGYNMFQYCLSNPVIFVDDGGLCPYNGTTADFHRLEYGLPALNCTCYSLQRTSNSIVQYAEHHKKGTTNGANKNKHEKGKARKQKDNRGEKGDARRRKNPNKRYKSFSTNIKDINKKAFSGAVIVVSSACIVFLLADDLMTIYGIEDNVLIDYFEQIIWDKSSVFE